MRRFPPLPDLADPAAPDDLFQGHLWILELIDGTGLRFRMDESGLLRFGGPEATYADFEAVPLALRPAVRHVRARFDREAIRTAVADPAGVTFFGVATHRRGIDYDWDRIPPFLGTDVWVGDGDATDGGPADGGSVDDDAADGGPPDGGSADGGFRPPDAVAAIFDGVGLDAVNAVAREVNARDFDPDGYTVPSSAWCDGPAAGVVVRNKRGVRGTIPMRANWGDAGDERTGDSPDFDDLVATHAGRERFDRITATLERRGEPVTADALADRTVEAVARETALRFNDAGTGSDGLDPIEFRRAVVERAGPFLHGRRDAELGGPSDAE